ncbi:TRAP transporter substrate-binding protein DctP [Pseudodonghicola sp.]|uniref:TRAP transporter substrate-binding protein DctP n=1 Tax=Pseudodonghicola sp. TaxID=1969463 RepID=UPI003A985B0B
MLSRSKFLRRSAAALALALALPGAVAAQETLKAITSFPVPMFWSQEFKGFIDLVNEKGKGVVQIQLIGGPEVIPPAQQLGAVQRGIVDIQYGPSTHHLGTAPEIDAFVGATKDAEEIRGNGGLALMQKIFEEKLGVRLVALTQSGLQFHIWSVDEPKIGADGLPDLGGMRLRSQPIYTAFFESVGAVPVSVPVPDVYTGLERKTFDGIGWPVAGVMDLSWDKYLKYRIDPGFFNTDLTIIMNPETWAGLSDQAKAVITEAAAEHEIATRDHLAQITAETDAAVQKKGIKVITLEGEAAKTYLDRAYGSAWGRLKASGSPYYDELRAKFFE